MKGMTAARPRVTALAGSSGPLRTDHVGRCQMFYFPHVVLLQALLAYGGKSELILYPVRLEETLRFRHGPWPR